MVSDMHLMDKKLYLNWRRTHSYIYKSVHAPLLPPDIWWLKMLQPKLVTWKYIIIFNKFNQDVGWTIYERITSMKLGGGQCPDYLSAMDVASI